MTSRLGRPSRVSFHPYSYNGNTADMIFIDGDHGKPAIADIEKALLHRIPIICLHDTNGIAAGYPNCFGSVKAGEMLRESGRYHILEDKKAREGERTHRGFMAGFLKDYVSADELAEISSLFERDDVWWGSAGQPV